MVPPVKKIRIIAQPRESYRERYESEQNRRRYAGQRYIRAEYNDAGLEYPTIEVPEEWLDASPPIHIRVASVTVPFDEDMAVCVHPYPIDSDQPNVLRDPANNALYFPLTNEDVQMGHKSFRLGRTKLLQSQLKAYGALRVINSNKMHTPRTDKKRDGKKLIKIYQLWKSQLLFSRAEHVGERVFNVSPASTVVSQITSDEMYQERAEGNVNPTIIIDGNPDQPAICAPNRGDWTGGENLLMVLPQLDREKAFRVYFDYPELNKDVDIQYELVDVKTILFKTPPCLLSANGQNRTVTIMAVQDDTTIGTFDFIYIAKGATPIPIRADVASEYPSIPSNSSLEMQHIITNNSDEFCPNLDDFFSNHDVDWL